MSSAFSDFYDEYIDDNMGEILGFLLVITIVIIGIIYFVSNKNNPAQIIPNITAKQQPPQQPSMIEDITHITENSKLNIIIISVVVLLIILIIGGLFIYLASNKNTKYSSKERKQKRIRALFK